LALFLIEAPQALLDQPQAKLNVEAVLNDLLGDARHFYRTPHKYDLFVLEEVDELTFLFGV
jgi:hypothetical protein